MDSIDKAKTAAFVSFWNPLIIFEPNIVLF